MNQFSKCCAFILGCIGVFISGPALAYAEGPNQPSERPPQWGLSPAATAPEGEVPEALPLSLGTWGSDFRESEAYSMLPTSLLAQQRMATQPPFIDFGKFEAGGFVGAVKFSTDFKASTDIIGGLIARVPVPGIPGDWGIWASLDAAGMTRDIPFFYSHKSGVWFSGNIGADYTFTSSDLWLVRAQAGVTYNYWNGLQSLDNNFAGTVGLDIGFYWIKFNHRTTVNLNPQISFNGSNYYAIIGLEFLVQF